MHLGWVVEARSLPAHEDVIDVLARAGIRRPSSTEDARPAGVVLVSGTVETDCELLRQKSHLGRDRVLALIPPSAAVDAEACWQYLDAGASDVMAWSDDPACVAQIVARIRRWSEVDALLFSPLIRDHLVGESTAWRLVVRELIEVARFASSSLLVLGESGTGKELIARVVHALDPRADKRSLVVLDCSTIVPELAGSEFFGHERGAFTGAASARDGAFELARGGTLFLDEVGELPLALQAQLLRVIQERTFKRVGGNTWQRSDFRLICATNRDLAAEVAAGRFRHDLYHRIASVKCRIPPLRERTGDILPLVRHFLTAMRPDAPPLDLDPAVRDFLLRREYPGNVRELRQMITRIAERHVGDGPITVGDIPVVDRPLPAQAGSSDELEDAVRRALARGVGLKEIGRAATDAAIRVVVDEEDGNLQRAARRLGVTDRALQLRRRSGDMPS